MVCVKYISDSKVLQVNTMLGAIKMYILISEYLFPIIHQTVFNLEQAKLTKTILAIQNNRKPH